MAKKSHGLPGTEPKRITHVSIELSKAVEAAASERSLHEWQIWKELLDAGLSVMDIRTGQRKQPIDLPATAPANFYHLSHYVALHTFAKDELLHQVMDDFFLLLWAAGPDNNCQHVNPLIEYYTGRSRAEFLGTGWIEMIHPDDREKTVQLCTENFRSRQAFQFRYRMRRRDRVWSWMQDHAEPRYRPDKSFAGYVGTLYQDPLYGPEVEAMAVTPPSWPLPASTGGIDSSAIRSKLN